MRHRPSPEDLTEVARLGLLNAIERFDPERGRPFAVFARVTIAGELKRHIRDRTWPLRVPRSLQERYLIVIRSVEELTQELGRSPRIDEVAARAGIAEDSVPRVTAPPAAPERGPPPPPAPRRGPHPIRNRNPSGHEFDGGVRRRPA